MVGTKIKNVAKHMAQIMGSWEGQEMTHRTYTVVKDGMGREISRTPSDTTVSGVISSLPSKSELRGAGWVNEVNMIGFFLTTDIEEHDEIIWDSETFEVIKIHGNLYDINTAVCQTLELARIPN